jgi:hypothetical protein
MMLGRGAATGGVATGAAWTEVPCDDEKPAVARRTALAPRVARNSRRGTSMFQCSRMREIV